WDADRDALCAGAEVDARCRACRGERWAGAVPAGARVWVHDGRARGVVRRGGPREIRGQWGDHGVDPVQFVRAVGASVVAEASVRRWVVADPGGGEWGERSVGRGPVADGLHDADADRRGCAEVAGDGVPQGARAEVEPVAAVAGGCDGAAVP